MAQMGARAGCCWMRTLSLPSGPGPAEDNLAKSCSPAPAPLMLSRRLLIVERKAKTTATADRHEERALRGPGATPLG